jgi:hypothetical protein
MAHGAEQLVGRGEDHPGSADRQGQVLGLNNAMDAISRLIGPQAALALFAADPNAPFWVGAGVTAPAMLLALAAGRSVGRRKANAEALLGS